MSARAKTSQPDICQAARALLEKFGEEALSMKAVADAVGIRAPSLYKRFASRSAVIDAAAQSATAELRSVLRAQAISGSPREQLEKMCHAFRRFAKKNSQIYPLMKPEGAALETMLAPFAASRSKEEAGSAVRTLVSYVHGFVSMELTKSFSGSQNESFQYGLTKVLQVLLDETSPE